MLYIFQRFIIYHPSTETPHNFKTLKINTKDVVVESLVTNQQAHKVILYFGGNAENVIYTAADFTHEFPEHRTYLLKYRGFSGTQGSASEENLFADALVLFDHIKQQPNTHITVIGRSLGSGIATYIATERAADKLVLVTPFNSLRSVAQSMLPMFPMNWLLSDHYDSKARAPKLKIPTLVMLAAKDQVIAQSHTESLIQSIPQHQLNTTTIQAGHNDLDLGPEYYDALKQFIAL